MAKKPTKSDLTSSQDPTLKDSQNLSENQEDFEVLLQKAKEALAKLNSQEVTLQESLALYKQGMQNLKSAQEILENAKLQYQEIKD